MPKIGVSVAAVSHREQVKSGWGPTPNFEFTNGGPARVIVDLILVKAPVNHYTGASLI